MNTRRICGNGRRWISTTILAFGMLLVVVWVSQAGAAALPPETVLSSGVFHTCALKTDGVIDCWGRNDLGQAADQAGLFVQVSAGGYHTCGLKADGSVTCWGANSYGQAASTTGPFTQIATGRDHTCGLKASGIAECWGYDVNGGTPDPEGPYVLLAVGDYDNCGLRADGSVECWGGLSNQPGPFIQVSVGGGHACGIYREGSVDCWGRNNHGESDDQSGKFTQISLGYYHSCGLKVDGSVDCWGKNEYGQSTDQSGPFIQISSSWDTTCGLREDGSVDCWGRNDYGQAEDQPGPYGHYPARPKTTRISVDPLGDETDGGWWQTYPALSPDGRFVAINLYAPGQCVYCIDVYVHDRLTNRSTLVPHTGYAVGLFAPAISSNGRYVAFEDENMQGEFNTWVYWQDRLTGETAYVCGDGYPHCVEPDISDDGRFVAFRSRGSIPDIFLYDRQTGNTTRVSDSSQDSGSTYDELMLDMTGDAGLIAFASIDDDLVPGDTNEAADIFIYERQSGNVALITKGFAGTQADGPSTAPAVSANGRYVVYASHATNLTIGDDTNGKSGIYIYDRQVKETLLVSIGWAGDEANGDCTNPVISADGRFVAYQSDATNLVQGDTNNKTDIFVFDRQEYHTRRISVDSQGNQTNGASVHPAITANGLVVAFASEASNLVSGDTNNSWDVFVHEWQPENAPLAKDDSYSTDEDQKLIVPTPGILTNDSGTPGNPLTASVVEDVSHGDLAVSADGSFQYVPDANYYGSDRFIYKAFDGTYASNRAIVDLIVRPVNDPPVAKDLTITTDRNVPVAVRLSATDVEDDPLTYRILHAPEHGTMSGTGGNLTYSPVATYHGSDSFTYVANDGQDVSNVAMVKIYINPVYDKPVPLPNNPFQLPTASDTTFVVDGGGKLDQYFFPDQGAIEFNIYIDRVVGPTWVGGALQKPETLIANGIVSPKVTLLLTAFDVDSDYPGGTIAPEIDKIFLNDHEIGQLKGSDGQWSLNRFEIDTHYFNFGYSPCWHHAPEELNYLSFCREAPEAGRNKIRIEIDTENYDPHWQTRWWGVAVGSAVVSFETARPILFVHGRGGSGEWSSGCLEPGGGEGCDYWDKKDNTYYFGFRQLFHDAGFLGAITENFLSGEGSMDENAQRLGWLVDAMLTRYGVDKINIVAHSKGGLDSRAYISNSKYNEKDAIAALVTLASPHHGSYLADYGMSKPDWLVEMFGREKSPAMENLTESYMNSQFNPTHPAHENVQYFSIFADSTQATKCKKLFYDYNCPDPNQLAAIPPDKGKHAGRAYDKLLRDGTYLGRNDFSVTIPSARMKTQTAAGFPALPGHNDQNTKEFGPYFLNHHSIRAALRFTSEKDTTIANLVMDLLDIKPDTIAASAPQPSATSSASATAARGSTLGLEYGIIAEGDTVAIPVGVGSTPDMRFFLLWAAGDLNMELVDPQGEVIKPDTDNELVTYNEDRSGDPLYELYLAGKWAEYHVIGPQKGSWQVKITAADPLPGDETHWLLYILQDSEVTLTVEPGAPWYPVGGTVQVTSRVQGGSMSIAGATVVTSIFLPDDSTNELPLYDDGTHGDGTANDGLYGNSFAGSQFGIYRLSTKATGTWEGIPFSRTAVSEVYVASGTASLSGTYGDLGLDEDGDGLFEALRVLVPVKVADAGRFTISGELRSSSGKLLATSNTTADLAAGQRVLLLDFSGEEIWSHQGSSPFKLTNMILLDMDTAEFPLQIDFAAEPYTTNNYDQDDFQHPSIYLTGETADYGVNTGGSDKFDDLVIEVQVDLESRGEYNWNGHLIDDRGREIGTFAGGATFAPGLRTITLRFDGQAISSNRRNGPFYLVDLEIWGTGGYAWAQEAIATEAYTYAEFEFPPGGLLLYLPLVKRH